MIALLLAQLPDFISAVGLDTIVMAATDAPYDEDDVTPGVVGFVFSALFAIAVILLGLDLYRRVRRTNYREQVRQEIAAELAEREAGESDDQRK